MAQKRTKRSKKRKARQKELARRKQAKQRNGKLVMDYGDVSLSRQLLLAEWLLGR